MKMKFVIGFGLVLAVASSSALAFQEQSGGDAAAPGAAAAAAPASEAGSGAGLAGSSPGADTSSGTEVRIPGLGKLGVLPKMDFGLELLYGASEQNKPAEDEPPSDDLTIRGTVKHKF